MKATDQVYITIAATYTAEPLEQCLVFWLKQLDLPYTIRFAPYNQIFQELLDPTSLFSNNNEGINLLLLRLEDWQGTQDNEVLRNIEDFSRLLERSLSHSKSPYLLCICPSSPNRQSSLLEVEELLKQKLSELNGLYLITKNDLELYPVEDYYDQTRDELGHIPYTSSFFTALGAAIARKIYQLKTPPHKVIVLDCDNTIWQGVVGEDGVHGIKITPSYRRLQKMMIQQKQAGMLLSLCSKNIESDILEVFAQRKDLELKLDDLVSWKVNWQSKSQNLRELANELNLGLDSFIFIDDNPVECAEVSNELPEVLTINLPTDKDFTHFLEHIWAFDHLKITEEDQQRTKLYQENLQRYSFEKETSTLADFLAGLNLEIEITEPNAEYISRVAQLTQRTNQFNFTTKRYLETEIKDVLDKKMGCRVVHIQDRFGDYGLVGVMLFKQKEDFLEVDTFLLSCRVLGRGAEYQMLQTLGKIAADKDLSSVVVVYITTPKNTPALNFLEKIGSDYRRENTQGFDFVFPTEFLINLSYVPIDDSNKTFVEEKKISKLPSQSFSKTNKNKIINEIARELNQIDLITAKFTQKQEYNQRNITTSYIPPKTFIESNLARILGSILSIDQIGLDDNYFELGGTSLQSVELFAQIEREFSIRLPLTTLLEAPTVRTIASLLNETDQLSTNSSLVLLTQGNAPTPLFLVHDGFGETLLYRNLALNLDPKRPVYGLQPLSQGGFPILHTRIKDIAAYYLEQIKTIQPEGPYLLGGMCAGGVIAFEMALQLQEKGQKVATLALIDSANIGIAKKIDDINTSRIKSLSSSLVDSTDDNLLQSALKISGTIRRKLTNVIIYELARVSTKIKCKLFDLCISNKIPVPAFLKGLTVMNIYNFAETKHRFTTKLKGDILLFLATQGEGSDTPFMDIYTDPMLGWAENVTGEVRVIEVPGGHSSCLQQTNVLKISEQLQKFLI